MPFQNKGIEIIKFSERFADVACKCRNYLSKAPCIFVGNGISAIVTPEISIVDLLGPDNDTVCLYDFPIALLEKTNEVKLHDECAFFSNHPLQYSLAPPNFFKRNLPEMLTMPYIRHILSMANLKCSIFFNEDGEITATSEYAAAFAKRGNTIPKELPFSICFNAKLLLLANKIGCCNKFTLKNDSLFLSGNGMIVEIKHDPTCQAFSAAPLFDISTNNSTHVSIFDIEKNKDIRFGVNISHNGDGNIVFLSHATEFYGKTNSTYPFSISIPFSKHIECFTETSFLDIYIPESPISPVGFRSGLNWVWCICQ